MNLSDLEHLDETLAMLHDIRDVYAEWEQAHAAYFGSGKTEGLERYEKATRAMVDKRSYWVGIEQYLRAVSVTATADTAAGSMAVNSGAGAVN